MSAAADGAPETGTVPAGPHRLSRGEWARVLRRTFGAFLRDDCMGLSQQVAFSSLLAFFPGVVALIGLLGALGLYDRVQIFLAPVVPHGVIAFLETLQRDTGKGTGVLAFAVGLAGAVWAASGAMGTVIKAVNRVYDRMETRPFWKLRALAIALVLATGATVVLLFALIVFGGVLGDAIASKAGLGGAFSFLWDLARWPIAFAGVLLFFAVVYYLAPNVDVRDWRWVSPGSVVGGVLWLALSGLFALYATFSDTYSKTYGSLAAGIVLLLWLNYSAFALLFGAELNAELDRQADVHAAGGESAGLIKPARRT